MKKLFIVMVLLITSLLTLTVCNRLEENNDTLLALIGLAGGGSQFTKTVALSATTDLIAGPFNEAAFRHYQLLFQPADIAGSGVIRSLSFRYHDDNDQVIGCPHVTVKLGHTSETDLGDVGTSMALNINQGKGSAITVLNNKTVNIPRGAAGDYFEIPLDAEFNYNGVDNLVVDLLRTSACTGEVELITGTASTPYDGLAYNSVSAAPDNIQEIAQDVHHIKFKFAGGVNKVDFADTYSGNSAPLSTTANFNKIQMLYNASSIAGSGMITGIGLQVSAVTSLQTYTYTMKLAHSTKIDLEVTWANNFNADPAVTVANSVQITVPAGVPAGEFVWFPVPDGVFSYNGTDNLLIELTVEAASGGVSLATHPTTNINRIYGNPASATASTSNSYTHQINLRFAGGTMDVVSNAALSDSRFFPSGSANGIVSLFRATELGTSGKITSVAFRAASNTNTGNYPSYMLIMGHTMAETLTSTADFIDQKIVYNKVYTIPNTFLAGDWIEIKLGNPFVYNGVDNLIIWSGSTANDGTGANYCTFSSANATRYPSHTGLGIPGVSYSGSSNLKTDIRLKVIK
ncbi:MAG: hypothetical protein JXA07_11075 [Spirochaetes bacterium]|nr:hypothetical protein [Spirochaetota bacterium]